MGEYAYSSIILDLGIRWGWVVSFTPRQPFGCETGWAPDPVWTLWRRKKSYSCRDSIPGRPVRSPSLYRLTYPDSYKRRIMNSKRKVKRSQPILITIPALDLSKYEIESSCWSGYESRDRGWTPLSVWPVVRVQSTNIQKALIIQHTVSSLQQLNAIYVPGGNQFIFLQNTRVEPG
jgi:hypothetical protein